MNSLNKNELVLLNGGWSWASFADGACGAITVADAGAGVVLAVTTLTSIPNPLGAALVIGSVACAGWGVYRLQ